METTLTAKVLTGKREFRAIFDKEKNMLIVQTTQKPQDNKANKEILKELKKFFKSEIKIVSGLTSKEKIIKIYLPESQVYEKLANTN